MKVNVDPSPRAKATGKRYGEDGQPLEPGYPPCMERPYEQNTAFCVLDDIQLADHDKEQDNDSTSAIPKDSSVTSLNIAK